jgi:hypothetical protein
MLKYLITDAEILYRRVPHDRSFLVVQDGKMRVSSQAFADRLFRPSVDCANLCEHDPRHTQRQQLDAVVSVVTGNVRAINNITKTGTDGQVQRFTIDVEHMPIVNHPLEPDNLAHAEIHTKPACDKNVFRKLKERLAQLANERLWEIEPPTFP